MIVVSGGIADKLARLGFKDRQKIAVIPTGVDFNRFRPDVDGGSIRREFNIPEGTPVISKIGMIRPDKGQKYFIRAVDKIANVRPDARFLIVGSATKPAFFEEIQKEIAVLRHRDKVILTDFRHDIEKVIAASDVIVNSSPWEPRSQTIHQAFAMKKMVVASGAGGNLESISHGETGLLFQPGDVEALSMAILSAMSNHTGEIRESAYQKALSDFSTDAMMSRTLDVYRMAITDKYLVKNDIPFFKIRYRFQR